MARYHGKAGVLYMSLTAGGATASVLYQTDYTMNTPAAVDDVTSFADLNMRYVQGIPDMQIDLSGIWDDTYDALWDASKSTDGVSCYLYPSSLVPTKYWYGPAWFSFNDVGIPVAGAVRTTGHLAANGNWGQY